MICSACCQSRKADVVKEIKCLQILRNNSKMASSKRPVLKVILCGEYGVGKSSIFRRFVKNTFVEDSDRRSTLGFDHYERVFLIDGKEITLQLWDTGGLERVASVTSSYFKYADGAILTFAYDGWESFSALSQHLLDIVANSENAKIFLCGNKMDLLNDSATSTMSSSSDNTSGPSNDDVDRFYEENKISDSENIFGQFFKISCKTNAGLQRMFEDIARSLSSNWKTVAPPNPDQFKVTHDVDQPVKKQCC